LDELVLSGTQKRFWGILVPAFLIVSGILFKFSHWGLRVFHPRADMEMRIFSGYVPPIIVIVLLLMLVALYWKYLGMSFQFMPDGLVLKHHGRRYEFDWANVQVYDSKRIVLIRDPSKQAVVHKAFFKEVDRLCELVREAHRYKRKDWGTGPR
jgi:hypothetical protein